jgi:hypothetical protein
MSPTYHHEEQGDEDDSQECTAKHAAEDTGSDRTLRASPGPGRN